MAVGFILKQGSLNNFLKGFSGMDDLVIKVDEKGINASGTMERSYFVNKWTQYRENEGSLGVGSIAIGQLELFRSLLNGAITEIVP